MVIDKYVEWAVCGDGREIILLPILCSFPCLYTTKPLYITIIQYLTLRKNLPIFSLGHCLAI